MEIWRDTNNYRKWLKKYKEKNKEKFKESYKNWLHSPKGRANKLWRKYNQMDKEADRGLGDLTPKWIVEHILSQPCAHCGKTGWDVIGCNRLDNSKPHTMDNVEPCCYDCNIKLSIEDKKQPIYQYTLDGELVKIWESARECDRNGFNQSAVCKCCKGGFLYKGKWINCHTYKGYRWSFEPL